MLQIKNLCKEYTVREEHISVLNTINLAIPQGEFIIISGESGCGKTTLLHIMAGLEQPTGGKIYIDEKDIYALKDTELSSLRNKKIGMIFQEFFLENKLTVLQNILFPVYVQGKCGEAERKKAEDILREVGIVEKINTPVSFLSGGQKQRAAIARALINNPSILLADEPTANLDHKTGTEIFQLLYDLHTKNNMTVILVTHNGEDVKYDRRFELKNAKLIPMP